jgi:hypothetical protein
MIGHHRHDDLRHVAEFFEGNTHAMDCGSLCPVHLIVSLGGSRISIIHCLQHVCLEIGLVRLFLQRRSDLIDAFIPLGWLGGPDLFKRSSQQAFFTLLQIFLK